MSGVTVLTTPTVPGLCQGIKNPLYLLLPCLAAWSQAQAQDTPQLENLLFEAVAIAVEEPADPAGGERLVRELSALPSGGEPIDFQPLMRQGFEAEALAEYELEQNIHSYESKIAELEASGGPYQPELAENLLALGAAYQEMGEHERAIEFFERAWHIERVNGGLFNLNQAPIVKELIESHLASGHFADANDQQEYLYFIQQKTYGPASPDILPAMNELAEWNIFAFNAAASGADNVFNLAVGPQGDSEAQESFLTRHLLNAQNLYRAIIQILLSSVGVADPRLLEAEKNLALTNYFFATNNSLNANSNAFMAANGAYAVTASMAAGMEGGQLLPGNLGYRHGRDALERRVEYLSRLPDVDKAQLASALVDLGDWLLLFNKRANALETYQEAQALLVGEDLDAYQELLLPAVPISLPTFLPGSHSRTAQRIPEDATLKYKGHIDVAFELNSFGEPDDISILDKTESATPEIEDRLVRMIRRSQFRPRFQEKEPRNEDDVLLRYYFTY